MMLSATPRMKASPGAIVRSRYCMYASNSASVVGSHSSVDGSPPQMVTLRPKTARACSSVTGTIGAVTKESIMS